MEANRANAKKPTGPRTTKGKFVSSRNAIRHALTSIWTIVGNESASKYSKLREALFRDYAPATTQEEVLVDRVVSATWRTLRARQMEQTLANLSIEQFQIAQASNRRNAQTDTEALTLSTVENDLWQLMHRYDTQISRDFFRSIEALRKLQNDRRIRELQERKGVLQQQAQPEAPRQRSYAAAATNWVPFAKQSGQSSETCASSLNAAVCPASPAGSGAA